MHDYSNGRIDIMLDLETLGRKSDSTIFQIAAIAFEIDTGVNIAEFNQLADISLEEIKVEGSTLKWWLQTNSELLTMLISEGRQSPTFLIYSFYDWLMELTQKYPRDRIYLWGNGILFDNHFIKDQFEANGLEYPIFFRNDRDLRTLVDLAAIKLDKPAKELQKMVEEKIGKPLTKHNAIDDVQYQINVARECYGILMEVE